MKKLVIFVGISFLVCATTLVFTNVPGIIAAFKGFPLDRIIAFILGGIAMFIAGIIDEGISFKKKKKDTNK